MSLPKDPVKAEEYRRKMADIKRGTKLSDEVRAKMRVSQRKRWENPAEREKYSKMVSGDRHPQWHKDREQIAGYKRLVGDNRKALRDMMLIASPVKKTAVEMLLGYTADEFKRHIEKLFQPGMTWENYGRGPGKWNIDHITPLVEWHTEAPIENVSSLDNIQPLWSEENSQKNAKGTRT